MLRKIDTMIFDIFPFWYPNRGMEYRRLIADKLKKSAKSILLLGPRQTGKSTLIRSINPDLSINLSREKTFLEFSSQPDLLEKILKIDKPKTVFIDEVQRIPSLLNTVQAILDDRPKGIQFYLTGSSARKLKRGQANLLPGRIVSYSLGPLAFQECRSDLTLGHALAFGSMPGILSEKDIKTKKEVLRSYAGTYLKEEIQAEALTKNIEGFSRFLMVAASKSGEFLDFSKLGSQASISQKASSRFFEILEDTLIVSRLNSFSRSETRRLVQHPKFYFFDLGVLNGLLQNFTLSNDRKGFLFEHFIVNQILTLNKVHGDHCRISTYRTEGGSEVDIIIENESELLSVEIKSSENIHGDDFLGLKRFAQFYKNRHRSILIYAGARSYKEDRIEVLSWARGLDAIFEFMS